MKLLVFIVISWIQICCGNTEPTANGQNKTQPLAFINSKNFKECDSTERIAIYYFIVSNVRKVSKNEKGQTNLDYCDLLFKIRDDPQKYSLWVDSMMRVCDSSQIQFINNKAAVWIENQLLIDGLLESSINQQDVVFEEIMSSINDPNINSILKSFLSNKDQYWGSLDGKQSCNFYYSVQNFASELQVNERTQFLKNFMNSFFKCIEESQRKK